MDPVPAARGSRAGLGSVRSGAALARRAAVALLAVGLAAAAAEPLAADAQYAAWVQEMKARPQGPFLGVRWFCADGTIQLPREYACRERGGGRQSGQRDERAEAIRNAGIPIANVLSELTPEAALADDARLLKAVLLEQFLVDFDDGWILRRARYVRGMFQAEDEANAARSILLELARDPRVAGTRFALLREAVRLLPRPMATGSFGEARAKADELARRDPGFVSLRNLIHSRPEPALAARVRTYARAQGHEATLRAQYEALADTLERAFAHTVLAQQLDRAAATLVDPELQQLAGRYGATSEPARQLELLADILVRIREAMAGYGPERRVLAIELSLAAEEAAFAASRQAGMGGERTRHEVLASLRPLVDALHGTGLLTRRERTQLQRTLKGLLVAREIELGAYRQALAELARAPGWSANRLRFHFGPAVHTFARVEPLAHALIPDRLHSSPVLAYGERLEWLGADGDALAMLPHRLFGRTVRSGLRVLNPGVARGRLQTLADAHAQGDAAAIVLVPETTAELPPVAGILTESAGNAVSHVQLLARNLGLPNVVVDSQLLPVLRRQLGSAIVLAASPGGAVHLSFDGPAWDRWLPKAGERSAHVDVDTGDLDLSMRAPLPLDELRAGDAGRVVGPKAANLGELSSRYPGMVSAGLAVPFGVYRSVLERPAPDARLTMYEWLQLQHRLVQDIDDPAQRARALSAFLQRARDWFRTVEFPDGLVEALREQAHAVFGTAGSYGVFVRSDTNLEDLPGFTGAGLNRTVPNVVGFDAMLDAIRSVWASPFSERAYGWRQMAMDQPQHVYVSVLLHRTVPSEKSGVMVTADPDTGDRDWTYISANEGAGGAVDGQSAENLRVRPATGEVELVSSATEPTRREVVASGGLREVPASGDAVLLTQDEIRRLLALARSIPRRYPQLVDAAGEAVPADVEFAFAGGRLYLLQIRPFLQSARAQRSALLMQLDRGVAAARETVVDLEQRP